MKSFLAILAAFGATAACAQNQFLPTAYPVNRYTDVWEKSPFNRVVVKEAASGPKTSFSDSLVLEGVVTDDTRGTVAYVRDTREDKPIVITSEPTKDHPYRVVSATQDHNPEATKVTITDGSETGEIGFSAQKLTQAIAVPASAPAQPQNRPGNQPPKRESKDLPQNPNPGTGAVVPPVNVTDNPGSGAPALDKMDEPRRRRVPLPGQ